MPFGVALLPSYLRLDGKRISSLTATTHAAAAIIVRPIIKGIAVLQLG